MKLKQSLVKSALTPARIGLTQHDMNDMEAAWSVCKEAALYGKKLDSEKFPISAEVLSVGKQVAERCRKACDSSQEVLPSDEVTDELLVRLTRFTDGFPLKNYEHMLRLVPQLVNVVTESRVQTLTTTLCPIEFCEPHARTLAGLPIRS